ncbi:restriction endonuclease subunit S [uncultured Corynebacterium sp.]|uniref:restriction endonuclease subunit S n=1 Tax=uncultured Corynebacterium sp. TaxID=159447 RepID=UPI0025FAD3B2|nr:restriction endonuclease subunit S [uncultured Corynebacterium sp.]
MTDFTSVDSISKVFIETEEFRDYPLRPLFTLCSVYAGEAIASDDLSDEKIVPVYGSNGIRAYTDKPNHLEDQVLVGRQGSVGTVHFAKAPFWAAEHALVVEPITSEVSKQWLKYVLETLDLSRLSRAVAQPGINASSVSFQRVPTISLGQQKAIADFLDRETAEIDAAVADLDKYMKLLRLRARKLINEQLMSGYPEVKMGLLAESIIGLTYRPENVVDEGGIYVYRSGNVQESKIDRSNMLAVDVEVPPHLRFKRGDILMCSRNGSANLVGKNAIVDPCDYGQTWGAFMTVIRSDLNRYLYWFFRSPRFDDYRGSFSSSTINQLTTGILNRIPVPLPPENKRDEITAFLEEEVSKIDSLIEESIKLRDLLLKRRSVLITEVVTGRKQV